MASLYAAGWRQGSILVASLPLDEVVPDADGHPVRRQREHGRWVVASQDCDLDLTETNDPEATIELRPVHTDDPPTDWGLRSSRLLLTETEFVVSAGPRTIIAAAVLTALVTAGAGRRDISAARERAFTTWLGLRYDRPALPPELLPLARRIADEVQRRRNRPTARLVREVLMQFDETRDPIRFSLFAVVENAGDEDTCRQWLADIARRIPVELGLADEIEAAVATGISLHLVETSYAADVAQLTWRTNRPDPEGAV
jgi:hypothetical protein